MANICFNIIKIFGEETKLEKLKALLDKCLENNIRSLKKVAKVLKVTIPDDVCCRGDILYVDEIKDNILSLQTETAWSPMDEYWDIVTEQLEVHYASLSEECGMEIYVIHNDPEGRYFSENYGIDIWEEYQNLSSDYFYFDTEKEICEFMQERIPDRQFRSFEDVKRYFADADFGTAYEYVRD